MKNVHVGSINIANTIIVADPDLDGKPVSYEPDARIENVLPGRYNCFYAFDESEKSISAAYLVHESIFGDDIDRIVKSQNPGTPFCTDSTLLTGMYDGDYYAKQHTDKTTYKAWYDDMNVRFDEAMPDTGYNGALVADDKAFITYSGFGEDEYFANAYRNENGQAYMVAVEYYRPCASAREAYEYRHSSNQTSAPSI